ncbi:hypothetical protein SAMN05421642_103245 [Rhodococcoides kyotonense]|uniref:Uncharacterized protein n=1 Tax=Rhodococcoides kyotonense TaxID=398843 RepID=A0A239FFT2_9NOCA|nr:hypothetical protein SAMN05421642_103245 [Rhodococcus kyotonensis]
MSIRTSAPDRQLPLPEMPVALADTWPVDAEAAIAEMARRGIRFSAYDLTENGLPDPPNPRWWGVAFMAAHRAGIIEKAGVVESRRPSRAHGLCRMWTGSEHPSVLSGVRP